MDIRSLKDAGDEPAKCHLLLLSWERSDLEILPVEACSVEQMCLKRGWEFRPVWLRKPPAQRGVTDDDVSKIVKHEVRYFLSRAKAAIGDGNGVLVVYHSGHGASSIREDRRRLEMSR